jgi:hypothetical protein
MKIYNKNSGHVVYDNLPGASDAVNPVVPVADNSSVVVFSTPVNNIKSPVVETDMTEVLQELQVKTYPNPSNTNFTITTRSNLNEQVRMQVTDLFGRVIESRILPPNSAITIGENYRPGLYLMKFSQGKIQKQIKLIRF